MNLTQDQLIALAQKSGALVSSPNPILSIFNVRSFSFTEEDLRKFMQLFAELLTNSDAEPVEVVTDEEIQAAFNNTNFGRTDFKMILLEGVDKTALGYHNGWTLTQIIRNLGLGVASSSDSNRITRKGLDFIVQCRASHSKAEQEAERYPVPYYAVVCALVWMCQQYMQRDDGRIDHQFMSAGEAATEALEMLGLFDGERFIENADEEEFLKQRFSITKG